MVGIQNIGTRNNIYIGIDPDVDKSGVAIWNKTDKSLKLFALDFFDTIFTIDTHQPHCTVVIEAGWLNKKSNYHQSQGARAERIAKNVGENHAIGKLFEKYCIRNKYRYELIQPKRSKVTADYFSKLTGITDRTNQEKRDAAMLVINR